MVGDWGNHVLSPLLGKTFKMWNIQPLQIIIIRCGPLDGYWITRTNWINGDLLWLFYIYMDNTQKNSWNLDGGWCHNGITFEIPMRRHLILDGSGGNT